MFDLPTEELTSYERSFLDDPFEKDEIIYDMKSNNGKLYSKLLSLTQHLDESALYPSLMLYDLFTKTQKKIHPIPSSTVEAIPESIDSYFFKTYTQQANTYAFELSDSFAKFFNELSEMYEDNSLWSITFKCLIDRDNSLPNYTINFLN